ncbi:MAG TPA: endopeptidase La [Stellaceae bacterium]|nr:endopeptidase La [Stellaceae bacterium]
MANTDGSTPPRAPIALPENALIILPVRSMVLFPGMVLPLTVGRTKSVEAAQEAVRSGKSLGIVLQRQAETDDPGPGELHEVGTAAAVLRYLTAPDGSHHLVCQGQHRFRIIRFLEGYPFLVAQTEPLGDSEVRTPEIEARLLHLRRQAEEAIELLPQVPPELGNAIRQVPSAGGLADLVASVMDIGIAEKQEVLEIVDVGTRLRRVSELMSYRLEVLRLTRKISDETKENVEGRQREYMLREQLKTIQKELGEGDSRSEEVAELEKRIADAGMPEEVATQARRELSRLERLPEGAAEYSMMRNYLDWLVELPWSVRTEGAIDIAVARKVLDEDHFGLAKVKRRILEYLAVQKLKPGGKSPILCFVGPPGIGKTSLGQSIARATGRKFVRVSLGGVHDEAEIRGHRRTYVGALPGNIVQGLRKAGARDCVMMLDEIDKLGAGIQGDPSSALLEVLDPEQNSTFRDNYLGVPFDLSSVLFIATANMMDTVPGPLRDRMEVIELTSYTEEDKLQIAKRYLVPRQREANGVTEAQSAITDEALRRIIRDYTREAGVRTLERTIGAVFRSAAMRVAEGSSAFVEIGPDELPAILGAPRFENEMAMRTSIPGVATGLAWTPVGGDILFIEATRTPGAGKLILTGQLGEVMKESAQAALSLVKSRARAMGIDETLFAKSDIHIHVPAGAIPKDGPSAGVAMTMALVSLMTGRPTRSDTAMTGEISLRGLVLPVGGIKEKVTAAARAGITTVLLPARNRRDLEDISEEVRKTMRFVWCERIDDAVAEALELEMAAA